MDLDAALREHFGFERFRAGQREACAAALAERDVLVVMPTGSGKSLCYQLPALVRDDVSIVVSPLVSLMQDQVEALRGVAPGRVAVINAQQDGAANREALARAVGGDLRLLYVAPERFSSPGFVERLRAARIGLFVVDEAHCVSQWGHDFRPDYFRLADAARYLGARAIVASTATATPRVADDVVARLGLRRDAVRVTTGFDRPNLSFAVGRCTGEADKRRRVIAALREEDALPAIVYAGTRAGSEALADELARALGREVLAYHAGLAREQRAAVQRRFMGGEVEVVVATNAFGMGVDKADVRTVVHATVPGSLEALYQEAGRAGRDGRPARCLLFAQPRDKGLHVFFIERARLEDAHFGAVGRLLEQRDPDGPGVDSLLPEYGGRYDAELREACAVSGLEEDGVRAVIGHMARAKLIQPAPSPPDRLLGRRLAPLDGRALAVCRTSAREAERMRWRQYRAIWAFVEGDECRRVAILRHFGDHTAPSPAVPCCDVCDAAARAFVSGPAGAAGGARRAGNGAPADGAASAGDLDGAIFEVVRAARPAVGRTRTVEILRGGRSKVIRQHAYDGLPGYGTFAHLTSDEVLRRVDGLLAEGRLRSTGGRFPKLAPA